MKRRWSAAIGAALTMMLGSAAHSQGGGLLDAQTQYQIITGPGSENQHGPLLAIILWRGPIGWYQPHTPSETARADSIYRWTRLHADATHQSFFGSGLWYGLLDPDHRAVTVEGTRIPLDSSKTRVIMVTVPPNNLPRQVTRADLVGQLPVDFWSKQWTSGDTTFFVRPDYRRQQAMLREALVRSPAVAAYLGGD